MQALILTLLGCFMRHKCCRAYGEGAHKIGSFHTSCRQNIMHEKWGDSDLNGFDTKRMMKSNAIIYFFKSYGLFWIYQLLHIQSSPKCRIGCGLLAVSSKTASQDLKKKMVLLFTVIFMSKPLTQCSPIFHP